jgi:hypothetical protein
MRHLLCIALALCVASCAAAGEPRIVTKEVSVPVAVKCSADPGPAPAYVDTAEALKAAPDVFERVKLLLAGRLQRMAREAELVAANAGCR